MIDQVSAIKTHTFSSKSELFLRGRRPFKVLGVGGVGSTFWASAVSERHFGRQRCRKDIFGVGGVEKTFRASAVSERHFGRRRCRKDISGVVGSSVRLSVCPSSVRLRLAINRFSH